MFLTVVAFVGEQAWLQIHAGNILFGGTLWLYHYYYKMQYSLISVYKSITVKEHHQTIDPWSEFKTIECEIPQYELW
jgi:hypothetical protein